MTVQNSLTKKQDTFSMFIGREGAQKLINTALGSNAHKFTTSIISTVANNPELQKCEFQTILSGALLGESLKLSASPQLGQFYLVPFKDTKNNRVVATFVLGYKGYIQLAIRSGMYKKLVVIAVKEGELISYNPIEEEAIINILNDTEREKAKTVGYYAMFEYINGFRKPLYWSKEKMEAHAQKYSKAYKTDITKGWNMSFWSKDFDAMAFKTMLRQLISKWGVMSVEFQRAYEADTAIIEENKEPQYIDTIEAEPIQDQSEDKLEKVETQETKEKDPFDIAE